MVGTGFGTTTAGGLTRKALVAAGAEQLSLFDQTDLTTVMPPTPTPLQRRVSSCSEYRNGSGFAYVT